MHKVEELVALSSLPGLGSIKIRLLLEYFGSAKAALEASAQELLELPGFSERSVHMIVEVRKQRPWERDLERVESAGVQLIAFDRTDYPKGLLDLTDYPLVLYVKGTLKPEDHEGIAIVGTRKATLYGKEMARTLGRQLAGAGQTVVSGLARGVDTCAHQGALEAGRTVAVIGSGLGDIYPQENERLAELITQKGALISEFPMMTPPDRQNFPQRNRIVAAMTKGTLLIEAPAESGAMITMHKAMALGRPLWALPGRVDVDSFKGNHTLIKSGKAKLVESVDDICPRLDTLFELPERQPISLESDEQRLLDAINGEEKSIEELASLSQLTPMKLNVLLMSLVLKRRIKEYPGKFYRRVTAHG